MTGRDATRFPGSCLWHLILILAVILALVVVVLTLQERGEERAPRPIPTNPADKSGVPGL
jgi:hypothetical protein